MKKRNWLQILASYTGTCREKIALSVLFAVTGIIGGFVPYYAVYQLIRFFIHADRQADGQAFVLFWCAVAAAGYVVKTVFNSVSTTFSHKAAFTILEELRLAIADRMEKAPLGTAAVRSTGSYKDIILDRVEEIEKPLAHLIPEAISALTKGKTIITIAHRLATIEQADQIIVLEEGRISQKGTHAELMGQEGLYRTFVEIREKDRELDNLGDRV